MTVDKLLIPKLPDCQICRHPLKLTIQKALDAGITHKEIIEKYQISENVVSKHNRDGHREQLIVWASMDYQLQKEGVQAGKLLCRYIRKWAESLEIRKDKMRDADAIKALELYSKLEGNLTEKHEITVKKDLGEAIKDFLDESEEKPKKI